MKLEDYKITEGLNKHQNAAIERNDKTLDYFSNKPLSYSNILNIVKGLNIVSEFFDVNAVVTICEGNISAVALGKSLLEAISQTMDSNPIDFVDACVVVSAEVDSDAAKLFKPSNIVVAPKFTKNAIEYFESREICYVTIETPLKDYKKFLSQEIIATPLGTLMQAPNLSELNTETFKVVSQNKPTVEQIEDAVFAWKIVKHARSRAVAVVKDLKTSAISQGEKMYSTEHALDNSCEMAKDAVLASDSELSVQDINAAVQCRIGALIVPSASAEVVKTVDKYGLSMVVTGITNTLY